jgi:SAM-dependent methyltransferase
MIEDLMWGAPFGREDIQHRRTLSSVWHPQGSVDRGWTIDLNDTRTAERLREHYDVEVELAARLKEASSTERRRLYGEVYDELFARVPDHPQLARKTDPHAQAEYARRQTELIRQFLPIGGSYVEIGAGDCATVRQVAELGGSVTAVEVSADIVPADLPSNVTVAISDGVSVPVQPGSADLVYSNQLMEHLHPDDAAEQLRNIVRALRPGGRYICITPNRYTGPHDISARFADEPRGFHLREYGYRDLRRLFESAGLRRVRVIERGQGRALTGLARLLGRFSPSLARSLERWGARAVVVPVGPYALVERAAEAWPGRAGDKRIFRRLLGVNVIAERG